MLPWRLTRGIGAILILILSVLVIFSVSASIFNRVLPGCITSGINVIVILILSAVVIVSVSASVFITGCCQQCVVQGVSMLLLFLF